ncbi:MAG: hypothetical protein IK031_02465 [Bacteroidales bacterium]|nr:hypothetical protein [Bacteroidales bacterium]
MKALKTISAIALAALVLAGCEKETNTEFAPAPGIKAGELITITATNDGTKTVIASDAVSILWNKNDSISVFYGDGGAAGSKFVSKNTEPAATAEFTGVLNMITGVAEGNEAAAAKKFWGVYPHSATTTLKDGTIKLELPNLQNAVAGSFDPAAFPAVACSDNLQLAFRNACGLLKVNLQSEGVYAVTIHGNNNENVWGAASITLDSNGIPQLVMTDDPGTGYETGILSSTALSTSKSYYIVLPPTTFTKGVEFEFYDETLSCIGTLATDKSLSIERNKVASVTLTLPEPPAPELTVERIMCKVPRGLGQAWTTEYSSTTGSFIIGNDRSAATDGEYAFVVGASTSTPGILAINLNDPTDVKELNISNFDGGYLKVASLNTIYNPTTQKYILLACSLSEWNEAGDGYQLNIYAFLDGIDQPATRVLNFKDSQGRHLGEIFSVVGDWSNGEIWVRNRMSPSTLCWPVKNGVLGSPLGGSIGYDGSKGLGVIYKYGVDTNQVLLENENLGIRYNLTLDGYIAGFSGVSWAGKDQSVMGRKYGVTPFEFNGNKYIAYTQVGKYTNIKNGARARLKIIADQGSAELFGPSIEADNILFEYPIQNSNDNAVTEAEFDEVLFADDPSYIIDDRVLASCSVVKTDDAIYILSHCYNVGLSVFKMYMK